MGYVFVTVGTTKFDELVRTVTSEDILDTLVNLGYKKIVVQTGGGAPKVDVSRDDIQVEAYEYKDSIEEDLKNASLVVSHAGAGTVLESLELKKRLLVVINDELMDNHQSELAEKMSEEGHLHFCTCETLKESLMKDFSKLVDMKPVDPSLMNNYLNRLMNVES